MSSTDRADQYPEVSSEDSGLVPQLKAEWPKKIRTLTATELDRLTIDSGGRFYWDGHLVNYEGPNPPRMQSPESRDAGALDLLDRAAMEITGRTPPNSTETPAPVDLDKDLTDLNAALNASEMTRVENKAADVMAVEPSAPMPTPSVSPVVQVPAQDYPMLIAPAVQTPDKFRVSLSVWQSIGAVLIVLSFLVAAAGLGAQGWVAASEWGCRIGMVKACPPPPPAPKIPTRPDIPE